MISTVVESTSKFMSEEFTHIPVMFNEVQELLNLKEGQTLLDCTLGLGGHSSRLVKLLGPSGRLIGLDQDTDAISYAKRALNGFAGRLNIVKSNFRLLSEVLDGLSVEHVDGVFFDLGVSSLQLDNAKRGFSFRTHGPLDMRMDQDLQVSAFELINTWSEEEIARLLWQYGDERFSRRIARAIVRHRSLEPIETTWDLSQVIMRAMPYKSSHQGIHPATRSFQALRIAVNQELDALEIGLDQAFDRLKVGGRLCVIAFHSLEDRIVKEKFKEHAHEGRAKVLTKKPLRPSDEEAQENPRSRSSRVRGLEKSA